MNRIGIVGGLGWQSTVECSLAETNLLTGSAGGGCVPHLRKAARAIRLIQNNDLDSRTGARSRSLSLRSGKMHAGHLLDTPAAEKDE